MNTICIGVVIALTFGPKGSAASTLATSMLQPSSAIQAARGGFRLTPVGAVLLGMVVTSTIAILSLIFAIRTFRINRGTYAINKAKDARDRQALDLDDPSIQQRIVDETEQYFSYLKTRLWSIFSDVQEITDLRAHVDRNEKHYLMIDDSFFPLSVQYEHYLDLLEDLTRHRDQVAGYSTEIRSRLRALSKTEWRLNDQKVPAVLAQIDFLTSRMASLETIYPSEISHLAKEAHEAVTTLLEVKSELPPD